MAHPFHQQAPPTEAPRRINPQQTAFFASQRGTLYCMDALDFLSAMPDGSVDTVFADPPYNIGKADWDTFASRRAYIAWVQQWLTHCQRILKPTGTMYVMGFSEILAHISVMAEAHFHGVRWLIWHYRNKPSMGKSDWVRSHESILHLRKSAQAPFYMEAIREPYNRHTKKYPERDQGKSSQYGKGKQFIWSPDQKGAKPRDVIDIPALSNGMKERTNHPTQKPEELLRRLLLAVTQPDDMVVDPFGGSGTTFVVCEQLKLRWLGSEQSDEYCQQAANRLSQVPDEPLAYWLEQDWKRRLNRQKVRGYNDKSKMPSSNKGDK